MTRFYCVLTDRADRHDLWSRLLLIHSPLFPSFFRREEKRGKEWPKSWSKVMPFWSIVLTIAPSIYLPCLRGWCCCCEGCSCCGGAAWGGGITTGRGRARLGGRGGNAGGSCGRRVKGVSSRVSSLIIHNNYNNNNIIKLGLHIYTVHGRDKYAA